MRIRVVADDPGVLVDEISGEDIAEFGLEFFTERIQAAIEEAERIEAAEAARLRELDDAPVAAIGQEPQP